MRLPDPAGSQVVLIGTAAYRDEAVPDLEAVTASVQALAKQLTDGSRGIVPARNCHIVLGATDLEQVRAALALAAETADDLLLVYYCGHGLIGGRRNELFLGMPGSRWDAPQWGSLKYEVLHDAVLDSHAAVKALIRLFPNEGVGQVGASVAG